MNTTQLTSNGKLFFENHGKNPLLRTFSGMRLLTLMLLRFSPPLFGLLLSLPLLGCAPVSNAPRPPVEAAPAVAQAQPAPLPTTAPPAISGQSGIVIDAHTGRILAGKNPDERRAVASTQKLMTALLAVEAGPLDTPVTIALSDTKAEPTQLSLKPGEVYTRRQLIRVILVKSANDAAAALARDVAGSAEAVGDVMTRRARALGLHNTVFKNPHGLTVDGQYSTARDLALLARAAYRHPYIRECMRTRNFTFNYNDGRTRKLENTNKLLKNFPYTTGMKTGTTNASGKCLVSSADYNGRVAIAVVLKSTNGKIWNESESLLRWALSVPADPIPTETASAN